MEELGISPEGYALAMAEALAFLHWSARVDAGDVEFVLAPPRPDSPADFDNEMLGPHSIWILDFDCCREMEMNEAEIQQAARCFWRNDPYYPRPCAPDSPDYALWQLFVDRFLQASEEIISTDSQIDSRLPRLLVDEIVQTLGKYAKGLI
jgi:hypothetical protein